MYTHYSRKFFLPNEILSLQKKNKESSGYCFTLAFAKHSIRSISQSLNKYPPRYTLKELWIVTFEIAVLNQ